MPSIPECLPGRPLLVPYKGGWVFISAHDRFHIEALRRFKRMLANAHPDRRPQNGRSAFRAVIIRRKMFKKKEELLHIYIKLFFLLVVIETK